LIKNQLSHLTLDVLQTLEQSDQNTRIRFEIFNFGPLSLFTLSSGATMFGKVGIKLFSTLSLLSLMGLPYANAGLKQLEIKGKISTTGHTVDFGDNTDSEVILDADLDFKMKFSQDVSARLDLELDNANAGDATGTQSNRFNWGVDQAYVKMNDFLFRNLSLQIGKQDFNISLRDNNSNNWAWGDPLGVVASYSTRDLDLRFYYLKYDDDDLGYNYTTSTSANTNDSDKNLLGLYGEYWLNDDSLMTAYLNYKSNHQRISSTNDIDNVIHYGLGIDYFIGESIEIFAEVAGQTISGDDSVATGDPRNDGSAYQFNLGGEYTFSDYESKPQLSLEYYIQSGSDTEDPSWQDVAGGWSAADTDSIFMEANGSTGKDINPNAGPVNKGKPGAYAGGYSVIRLNGSMSPSKSTKIGLGVHFFTNEDNVANDDLGTEYDLYGNWKYSQDVTFKAGLFLVTDPGFQTEDVTGVSLGSSLVF